MTNEQPLHYDEPPNKAALALAAAVHAALLAALFFGVQWKNEQPGGMPVDVYYGNPAAALPPPRPVAEPEPEHKAAPKTAPKVAPKTEPKVTEKPQIDPQIAIKDKERREREEKLKREKEREEKEKTEKLKKQQLEEEQKQKEEKARKEEDDKKKREQKEKEKDAKRASDLAKQLERDLNHSQQQRTNSARDERIAAMRSQLEAEGGSATRGGESKPGKTGKQGSSGRSGDPGYGDRIRIRIKNNIILPHAIQGNPEAIFEVTQLPTGDILGVKLLKSSGNKVLDEAIERAINKSSPLPKPDNPDAFQRVLKVIYKPFDE